MYRKSLERVEYRNEKGGFHPPPPLSLSRGTSIALANAASHTRQGRFIATRIPRLLVGVGYVGPRERRTREREKAEKRGKGRGYTERFYSAVCKLFKG